MTNIFIDGSAGTTGLRIRERLAQRKDIRLIILPEERRKDAVARKEALNDADIAFLCLPDAAAVEAVSLVENPRTAIIDTSTAHRTAEGWTYGFPELSAIHRATPATKRVANPGCHASGFLSLIAPLVAEKILSPEVLLTCFSITGYTGGGKKMIAEYEENGRNPLLDAPRQYGIAQQHKHLKEMAAVAHLAQSPVFCPIVADFPCGMEVTVPLFASQVRGTVEDIRNVYRGYYGGPVVWYRDSADEAGFLSAGALSGKDSMQISVFGNDERILLVSRFDNLGKGASGAAIQNMNLLLGEDETTGLVL